jgi:hypothetical protein
MRFIRLAVVLVPALAMAGTLAACGGSASAAGSSSAVSPSATASVQPANPVTIVKMAGATTPAVYGQVDIYGDRYADGSLPGATIPGCSESYSDSGGCLESVQVYTYATAADQVRGEQENSTPRDGQVTVKGALFDLTVYAVSADGNTWVYPVSSATIPSRPRLSLLGCTERC